MAETPFGSNRDNSIVADDNVAPEAAIKTREPTDADVTLDLALSALTECIQYSRLHSLAVIVSDKFRDVAQYADQHLSPMPMPIKGLPSGKEAGKFISIDVGGTNLRVAFIELFGEHGNTGKYMST